MKYSQSLSDLQSNERNQSCSTRPETDKISPTLKKEELVVLESYLPQMMSRDEIRPIVEAKIAAMGEVDKSKMGMLIGSLMKELSGKADGGDVKAVVEELLK
jgi:uncharacterized protein YqeY